MSSASISFKNVSALLLSAILLEAQLRVKLIPCYQPVVLMALLFPVLFGSFKYLVYSLTFIKALGNIDIIGRLTMKECKKSKSSSDTKRFIQCFNSL